MPIPPFDSSGLLPPGVHDCTIEEIEARFAAWGRSGRRQELCRNLKEYLGEARRGRTIVEVVVDGSFVTSIEEPNDVDLLVVIDEAMVGEAVIPMLDYNLITKHRVRRRYPFDVLVAVRGSGDYQRHVRFFSRVRNAPEAIKGLLRVII